MAFSASASAPSTHLSIANTILRVLQHILGYDLCSCVVAGDLWLAHSVQFDCRRGDSRIISPEGSAIECWKPVKSQCTLCHDLCVQRLIQPAAGEVLGEELSSAERDGR